MPYKDPTDPINIERARASRRKHYQANKGSYSARAIAAKAERRKYLDDLKGRTPCTDCGIQYPPYVMDFDHKGTEEKVGNLSRIGLTHSWPKIFAEIAKCDIVCANCHRARTHIRRVAAGQASVSKTEGSGS